MTTLFDIIGESSRRWPRVVVAREVWEFARQQLATRQWDVVAHWGEPGLVHLAVREHGSGTTGILSLDASGGRFPSLGRECLPIRRLERAIADLVGLTPGRRCRYAALARSRALDEAPSAR